jgi:hypothetical protein
MVPWIEAGRGQVMGSPDRIAERVCGVVLFSSTVEPRSARLHIRQQARAGRGLSEDPRCLLQRTLRGRTSLRLPRSKHAASCSSTRSREPASSRALILLSKGSSLRTGASGVWREQKCVPHDGALPVKPWVLSLKTAAPPFKDGVQASTSSARGWLLLIPLSASPPP